MKRFIITIDGPSGAGKTTVSRALAEQLSYTYVDTGALYRAVAYEAVAKGIDAQDDDALEILCASLHLEFSRDQRGLRLMSNHKDITDLIRTPEISMFASAASSRAVVRRCLLDLQREMGRGKCVIFEGRDMGTIVFPDAEVKFYLNADLKTRALRRYRELSSTTQSADAVEKDMKRRDDNDSSRSLAPLKPAEDAIWIDATDISAEAVVCQMLAHVEERLKAEV